MTAPGESDTSVTAVDDDTAWAAVRRRDRTFDGRFVTGVLSTGIYCRPSCAARHPARDKVRFFADGGAARAAGLRGCRRCRPDDVGRDALAVAKAVALLSSDTPPALAPLAAAVGYSPAYFQRLFTRATGVSPARFVRDRRAAAALRAMEDGASITDAIYAGGFSAPSRFYDTIKGRIGMTPSAWKGGGRDVTIRWHRAPTPFGTMLVAMTDRGICRLSFDETVDDLVARFPKAAFEPATGAALELAGRAVEVVARPIAMPDLPLDIGGTDFQRRVWAALAAIPAGETRSYAQIAASIGAPGATRAVGSACGANHVAVLIPCHRALRSDGSLGGYAFGLVRKRALLALERASNDD